MITHIRARDLSPVQAACGPQRSLLPCGGNRPTSLPHVVRPQHREYSTGWAISSRTYAFSLITRQSFDPVLRNFVTVRELVLTAGQNPEKIGHFRPC